MRLITSDISSRTRRQKSLAFTWRALKKEGNSWRLARSTRKPIILHKANIGEGSHEIAKLHTAALANDDRVVDAALKQSDIVRTKDFRSFANAVKILSLPAMKGNNLIALSRSGGIAIVAADSAERYGFQLFPLPKEFTGRIHSYFRAKVIQPTNPLDLGDLFDFDLYTKILDQVLRIKGVDGILFQHGAAGEEKEPSRRLIHAVKELSFRNIKSQWLYATLPKRRNWPISRGLSTIRSSRSPVRR